jgi:aspartate aminotransferase
MKFANCIARLGTETAFEVLAKAKALEAKGQHIVHLEIGEPDFDTPRNIIEAAKKALDSGYTHYGPSAGLPPVRKAFADYITRTRGVEADPDCIVVTPGAKPIIFFTILALIQEGDEVIYPNPGFPIYESMINYTGARSVPIKLREENEFRMDIDELESLITDKTKMLIINSPQNPTGGMLTKEDLERIAALAIERDFLVLSDEVYSEIIYEGSHHSIWAIPGMKDHCVLLEGHSKTFAMTGWRLGYGVCPEWLAPCLTRLQTNSNSCTASFTQIAGAAAVSEPFDEVRKMKDEFQRRRDVIVEGLNNIKGITCLKPHGAFYVFPNITGTGVPSKPLADALLESAGVAGLSGTSFGAYGEGYLRFSYANSVENIKIALERINDYVEKLVK